MRFLRVALVCAVVGCGGVIAGGDAGPGADAGKDATADAKPGDCNCAALEWCQHDPTCGSTGGTCQLRPNACPDIYGPVCGLDGNVYPNECTANAAGVDVSPDGGCQAPSGYVSCGAHFCDATTSYCQSTGNDAIGPGQPCTYYSCEPLPPACVGTPDCDCFDPTVPCSSTCTWDGSGFQLVCFGG